MKNEDLVLKIQSTTGTEKQDAQLRLYDRNKGLVQAEAIKRSGIEEFEDLMQEGFIALTEAADLYDAKLAASFATYATLIIKQRLDRYIENNSRTVRIPTHVYSKAYEIKRLENAFKLQLGRDPTLAEKAQMLDYTPRQIANIENAVKSISSLDAPRKDAEEEDGETLLDAIGSGTDLEEEVLDTVLDAELRATLRHAISTLPALQRAVINARYLKYNQTISRKQVAQLLEISESTVYTQEAKAFRKLKRPSLDLRGYITPEFSACDTTATSLVTFRRTWTSQPEQRAIANYENQRSRTLSKRF